MDFVQNHESDVLDVTPQEETATETEAAVAPPAEAAPVAVATAPAAEAPAETAALDPELVAAGERVFRQCSACHKIGEGARNGTGPMLTGIVDHPIGQIDGFRYSNGMAAAGEAGQIWTEEALAAFLADPRGYMPGTKMSFRGVRSPDEATAVIAYLRSFQ